MSLTKALFSLCVAFVSASTIVDSNSLKAEPINIGQGISIVWAPAYVANAQKLWQAEQLEPNILLFPSGRAAQEALVGGGVSWSTVAETPVVFAALNKLPVRIIATMNAYDCFELATVSEIKSIEGLKGKKIGYAQGTNSHVYLQRALDSIGATFSDVTAVSLSPADMVTSLSNGNIDAFVWTEPHLSQAVALDPARFHRIKTPGLYKCYSNVVTLQSVIDENPELLVKSLRALIMAVDFIHKNPDLAISTTAEQVKMSPDIAAKAWKEIPFSIGLDAENLAKDLQAQAEWAIKAGLARPGSEVPDFHKVVVKDLLEKAMGP